MRPLEDNVPHLHRIQIFPIKSMPPIDVSEARVLRSGALEHDRTLAFFDDQGKFVNGKRSAAIHKLHAAFDPMLRMVQVRLPGQAQAAGFHLDRQRDALQALLAEYFGFPIAVKENSAVGWPDDLDCPGPTLISAATLKTVCSWFADLGMSEARLRFRTNLEIDGVEPFWEDRLYTQKGERVGFQIGEVVLEGNNPCQRCVVPTRDTATGEVTPNFGVRFRQQREAALPAWAERSRFNHFYRLAINTVVPPSESGKVLRVGDPVRVL